MFSGPVYDFFSPDEIKTCCQRDSEFFYFLFKYKEKCAFRNCESIKSVNQKINLFEKILHE